MSIISEQFVLPHNVLQKYKFKSGQEPLYQLFQIASISNTNIDLHTDKLWNIDVKLHK